MRAHVPNNESVAIASRARDAKRASGAAGTTDVLDDESLTEVAREDVGDDAADDVGGPPRREWYDQQGTTERIGLRLHADAGQHGEREQCQQTDHVFLPETLRLFVTRSKLKPTPKQRLFATVKLPNYEQRAVTVIIVTRPGTFDLLHSL
jgi:hypothetical protein